MNRLMDTWRVQKNNLAFEPCNYGANHMPRCLRLVCHNGNFFSDEAVQKCGFSRVRPTQDRNETGLSHVPSARESSTSDAALAAGLQRVLRFQLRRARFFLRVR